MAEKEKDDEIFDEKNVVKASWVTWGKINDWIKGTLVSVTTRDSNLPGKEGMKETVYELLAHGGKFHRLEKGDPVDPPVEVKKGEYWRFSGKPYDPSGPPQSAIDDRMRRIEQGQVVGLRFTEEIEAKRKGFNPTKVIRVFSGPMDEQWMGQSSEDVEEVGIDDK